MGRVGRFTGTLGKTSEGGGTQGPGGMTPFCTYYWFFSLHGYARLVSAAQITTFWGLCFTLRVICSLICTVLECSKE